MTTFNDLGIPFPLFKGRVEDCSEYDGEGECSLCGEPRHLFRLSIGAHVIVPCPSCAKVAAVDADDGRGTCAACGEPIALAGKEDRFGCYTCIRAGKTAFAKDTEFGMVAWEHAMAGKTHGLPSGSPGLPPKLSDAPVTYDSSGHEEWVQVPLPSAGLIELMRTPTYHTWQGEQWLFSGDAPMVFVGSWGKAEFARAAGDGDGKNAFLAAVEGGPEGKSEDEMIWDSLGPNAENAESPGVYVFQPQHDSRILRAHYDFD